MSKYKILWIDDKWEEMNSFKELCELPENGFDVVPCTNSEDGMALFESLLEEWSGVILDAKVLKNKESKVDSLSGLWPSIKKINKLSAKREVPYYIFTGQPDTASGTAFAEEHKENYYEKDVDDDRLINDIKKNADLLEETQIVHEHQIVFDTWPESKHDLLRILKVLKNENLNNNSVLNDIRKIMSDVVTRLYERGLTNIKHNATNLSACSKAIGQRYMDDLIPVYVQRAVHRCVETTNPGSHRSQVDTDVMKGNAPYLIRSLIFDMLDVLYWCKDLPPRTMREVTLRRVELAKQKYEKSQQERKESTTQKPCTQV